MKILNRYIIREHLGPLVMALSVIMFILLLNFLVKYIGQIFGKGLGFVVITKLITFNLAWMVALAVPMATLVAVLMAFGRLSSDNEITILKSSGIPIYRVMRPSLYLGIALTLIMVYFSDQILPESNHQARVMFRAIKQKKPTLEIQTHVFYDLENYAFLVDDMETPDITEWVSLSTLLGPDYRAEESQERLLNITIFDRSEAGRNKTILAREGYMVYSSTRQALIFNLFDGEFHELDSNKPEEYQRSVFNRHVVAIPTEDFELSEEQDNYRGDREMSISMMQKKIIEFEKRSADQLKKARETKTQLLREVRGLLKNWPDSVQAASRQVELLQLLNRDRWTSAQSKAERTAERHKQRFHSIHSILMSNLKATNKYLVEIHKKVSIPFASIVFVLVGAPLGIMARKGSMGAAISLSIGFFLVYWAFLIGGEDLADRMLIGPVTAMWAPNVVVGFSGLYLTWRAVREASFIRWDNWKNLFRRRDNTVNGGGQ